MVIDFFLIWYWVLHNSLLLDAEMLTAYVKTGYSNFNLAEKREHMSDDFWNFFWGKVQYWAKVAKLKGVITFHNFSDFTTTDQNIKILIKSHGKSKKFLMFLFSCVAEGMYGKEKRIEIGISIWF